MEGGGAMAPRRLYRVEFDDVDDKEVEEAEAEELLTAGARFWRAGEPERPRPEQ